jgi:transcriptional regulator GlxA family with amidase domain
MTTPGPAERTVLHVVADRLQLLDLAGPVEVFRAANLLGASPAYRNLVASPDGGPVRSDSGVTVQPDTSIAGVLEELSRSGERLHTLVVAGGIGVYDLLGDPELRAGLVALSERAERVTSVCTGSLLLADAGLLRDRRATTHWASVEQLARLSPTTVVEEDPIYVRDGDVWTSAGVTTGIDLALALVEEDHGIDLAHQVAGWLVVFAQRPGGQSQFSARIAARPARRRELRDLQHWMADHLTEDLSVPALAARAGMSERNFARAFRDETGTTPGAYVEALRLEAARRLLETTDLTVAAVAREVGLRSPERLHRAVRRRLGTTPDRYRQHFARS